MAVLRRSMLTGAALMVPVMTMFWLDYWQTGERQQLQSPGFIAGTLAEVVCVALATPAAPPVAIGAGLLAVPGSALLGRGMTYVVRRLERLI